MELWLCLVCAIIALLVLIVLTLLGAAVYSGLLHNIEISVGKPHISNVTVAYKFDRGPYNNCGYLFSETHSLAPKLRCIGIYYDDPYEVQQGFVYSIWCGVTKSCSGRSGCSGPNLKISRCNPYSPF